MGHRLEKYILKFAPMGHGPSSNAAVISYKVYLLFSTTRSILLFYNVRFYSPRYRAALLIGGDH